MKRRTAATLLITALLGSGTIALAGEGQPQTTCPVMGGQINKAQYVDVNGYRIYVCCPGCKGKIKAEPGKYIEKLEAAGVELEKAPQKEKSKGDK